MENLVEEVLKRMYPTYDGRYSEDHSVTEDNAFVNNAYFEEIDKILEEPALEPSLDRSTEVFYFV
jgi:hypothetical protein